MGENNESDNKVLEELAVITDKIQTILPRSKSTIIFEMDSYEFAKTKKIFSIFDNNIQRFKIDISDTEIVFLSENVFFTEEPEEEKEEEQDPTPVIEPEHVNGEKKENWFRRLFFNRK